MGAPLIQAAEELVVIEDITAAATVGFFITLPTVHLKDSRDLAFCRVVSRLLQSLTIELNVLLHSFLSRHEERRGEVKPLGASPNTALGRQHPRGIDRRIRLLEGLGKETVILECPEFPCVRERPGRGPRL